MKQHVWYDPKLDQFVIDDDWGFGSWLYHRGFKRIYLGEL